MKKLSLVILSLFCLSACIDTGNTQAKLDRAQDLMSEYPDSAKLILESMDRGAIHSRRSKARFALLFSQALDKNYIDVDQDTLIRVATNYYNRRGPANDRALAFFYSGRVYENAYQVDSAIIQYVQAEGYVQKTDDIYLKGLIASHLAEHYSSQHYASLAQAKYLEAIDCFQQVGHKRNILISSIGMLWTYTSKGEWVDKKRCLDLAEEIAIELQDTVSLLTIAHSRAAGLMDETSDYRSALNVLTTAFQKYTLGVPPRSSYFQLANIYRYLNKPDSALLYLQSEIENLAYQRLRDQVEINFVTGKSMAAKGNYHKAYEYILSSLVLSDSLYFAEKKMIIPELRAKYHNEQLTFQNDYLKRISRYQLIVTIVSLLFVILISLWLINRRQQKISAQTDEIEAYKDMVGKLKTEYEQLQLAKSGGNQAQINPETMTQRVAFLKYVLETTANYGYDKELYYSKIERFFINNDADKARNDSNQIRMTFRELIDARQPGVLQYIQDKYPQLTELDITIYCMICMDVSISAMCFVLGMKSKTIYNYRNLLRGKLDIINGDITIAQHFQLMCSELANA